jgi:hypothetical protein
MDIELKEVTIAELYDGYEYDELSDIYGYGGRLNIRPAYQREYIYKPEQEQEVIRSVIQGFPLNVIYWSDEGDHYELLDGQQRTLSICRYLDRVFRVDKLYFHNQTPDVRQKILDYKLLVYVCRGTQSEKLKWFNVINIQGERLSDQEMRNAVFTGAWLTDAKKRFSKQTGKGVLMGQRYLTGDPKRQKYLETVLKWAANADKERFGGEIEAYMGEYQKKPNANDLMLYFQKVINWVEATFPKYDPLMKGLDWGGIYERFKDKEDIDTDALQRELERLWMDDDVTHKAGAYEYVLGGDERCLNIRKFSPAMAKAAYTRQAGMCQICGKHFEISEMEADHITPWSQNGPTSAENCQMLCRECNRRKGAK